MTTSWKFEATTTKDKNFEILTILTNFESPWDPQMGPYTKNYCINDFIKQIWISSENLKHLRPKTKILKFWPFLGPHSPKTGPWIKILVQQFFGHGKVNTIWAFENCSSNTEGVVLFSSFGPFRALLGHSPKTGARIKILVHEFLGHGKLIIFWRNEIPSLKTVGGVNFFSFGPFWARFGP